MGSDSEFTSNSSCTEAIIFTDKKTVKSLIKRHKCTYPNCDAAFNRPWKLERHTYSHTKERPFKCAFSGCDKDYRSKSHLQRHILISHTKPKNSLVVKVPCPFPSCNQKFDNMWNLKKHSKTHIRKDRYSCTECHISFRKHQQLKAHLFQHTGDRPFICTTCNDSFITKRELSQHEKRHRAYVCKEKNCETECPNWTLLRKHMKLIHPKGFTCDFCQKTFKCKVTLEEHIMLHFSESDREVFKCTYESCTRVYFYKRNLKQHIRTFHEGNRFKCEVEGCGKTFATKAKLQNHSTSIHTNPKMRKPPKVLDERKPRKDKGQPKKSMACLLSGIVLPCEVDRNIALNNVTPEVELAIKNQTDYLSRHLVDSQSTSESETMAI